MKADSLLAAAISYIAQLSNKTKQVTCRLLIASCPIAWRLTNESTALGENPRCPASHNKDTLDFDKLEHIYTNSRVTNS